MITLTLEENQILENGEVIPDLSLYLKTLFVHREITLILKTHDATYHHCLIQKAVPYMKSAEFSPDHWVGEKKLQKGQTFIGGMIPTHFMRQMIHLISQHSFAFKEAFLWADLVTDAYGPLSSGWALIWHDHHLLVCQDGILRFSRPSYLPLSQELPALLRYLKRFGYEEEMPITLYNSSPIMDALPSYIQRENRLPRELFPKGLTLQIPELAPHQRLYKWPRKIRKAAWAFVLVNALWTLHFGWQINNAFERVHTLKHEIAHVPTKDSLDETKMAAFVAYRRWSQGCSNPLSLIRRLSPLLKDEAVATFLHWTPQSLILHVELNPTMESEQLMLTLRSQFLDHQLTWKAQENEPLKGVLMIEKKNVEKMSL